jgi:hypothetical protein
MGLVSNTIMYLNIEPAADSHFFPNFSFSSEYNAKEEGKGDQWKAA